MKKEAVKQEFLEVIKEYPLFANSEVLGILPNVLLLSRRSMGLSILSIIAAFFMAIFAAFGVFVLASPDVGSLVFTKDTMYFVFTERQKIKIDGKKEKKLVIIGEYALPFSTVKKAIKQRNILFGEIFSVIGTYPQELTRGKDQFTINITTKNNLADDIEALKDQLRANDKPIKFGIKWIITLVSIALLIGSSIFLILWGDRLGNNANTRSQSTVLTERDPNAPMPWDLPDSGNVYTSARGNYTITFLDAHFSINHEGTANQQNIITVYVDYIAINDILSVTSPLNRFVVYQKGEPLQVFGGGNATRMDTVVLGAQAVEAGDTLAGRIGYLTLNYDEPITFVKYGTGFDVLFSHTMNVRRP